ncbi:Alkaline phosphatase synthesis sensor protein PhoR [Candidatus Phycorickettsia trachydisci]|uniref:Alkaline phosphatase synthesis sensor protein PhoR n=1 Tax=Candidatus Phycorickettsia trachydisci TaxID=2115978 RepID=A0A2P1P998_9RICK|nr:HAMP domain-containing histidine kinase [Candidatus Phycorickettsia trachydisci]AVP87833.1 Alkaline phosphatase synthesis sensor protein PhoR [Candidatus Phycorickettsia trachydisci]
MRVIWNIAVFYSLVFVGFMFAIASNFASPQVMILMVNLIVIALLVRWQWALTMILGGILVAWRFSNYHFYELIAANQGSIKLQITYILLLMSSLLLIFLKPKQEGRTLAMARIKHLKSKILSYEACMIQAMSSNSKVQNLDQYYEKDGDNMSIAHMFFDFYENLSHEEQKETARLILRSVMRLENFEANLANIDALARDDVSLRKEEIDFTYLIQDRLRICRKLYEEEGNEKNFILNISENVKILGDRFYFEQMVDNLIINAIMYCTSKTITIHLEKFGPNSLRLYIRI